MTRFRFGAVLLTCVCTASLAARQQQPPTFRGGINLITLDITATGPGGWPVRDLRPNEITLIVNGRERPLKSFELMEVAPPVPAKSAGSSAAPPTTPKETAPPASNVGMPGRSVFFVIMHEHICPGNEHQALEGASNFIDQLSPRDRVAIITMPMGRVEVDTRNPRSGTRRTARRVRCWISSEASHRSTEQRQSC